MKIVFDGLKNSITFNNSKIFVLEISNKTLFSRIWHNLTNNCTIENGEFFSMWDHGNELKVKDFLICIDNPTSLPWEHPIIKNKFYSMFAKEFRQDSELQMEVNSLHENLNDAISNLMLQFEADYFFHKEWDFESYLKMLSLKPFNCESDKLIDNLTGFVNYLFDLSFTGVLVFCNLQNFLENSDLRMFYNHVFSKKINVLLVENSTSYSHEEHEARLKVDKDFLEIIS